MFEALSLPSLKDLKLTGGAGGNAGPATASGGVGSITPAFDNSNWQVATSGSKTTGGGSIPWLYLGLGAAALVLVWKRR